MKEQTLIKFHFRVFYEHAVAKARGNKRAAKRIFQSMRAYYEGLGMYYSGSLSYLKQSTLQYFS